MPAIRRALADPVLRPWACQAIEQSGRAGSQAAPDLIRLATADYARKTLHDDALRALGAIGPAASNAVPLLSAIAAEGVVSRGGIAVQALAEIGPPARSAAPAIGGLLAGAGNPDALDLLMALARIGETPEVALPALRKTMQRGHSLCQTMAAIALWNHDPANVDLQENINGLLRAAAGEQGTLGVSIFPPANAVFLCGPLLEILGTLGTNAVVFTPSIRRLAESGPPSLHGLATRALREIEGSSSP